MSLQTQFKIKNNPDYVRYLHENSHWYKLLNRSDSYFKDFENEVKTNYRLRASDRFERTLEMVEMVQNIFTALK